MKITKSLLREYIKEELALIQEADYTIPDEEGLEAEFNKLRRVRKISSDLDMNFSADKKQKELLQQVQTAAIEYRDQIREIEAVAGELDNWKRLYKNTQAIFHFMRLGGVKKGNEVPEFLEMSDNPLGEE